MVFMIFLEIYGNLLPETDFGLIFGVIMTENIKMNMKKPRKRNQTKIYAKIRPHANFQVNLSTRKKVMTLRKFHIFFEIENFQNM